MIVLTTFKSDFPYLTFFFVIPGADINIADEFGYTPLMNSIIAGYPLVAKKLLLGPCHCDQVSHHGLTALHMAVKKGSLNIVNMLLRAGARPDIRTRDNLTSLALAFQNHDTAIIRALLLGCRYLNPNLLINKSEFPFYHALVSNDFLLAKTLALTGYEAKAEMQQYLNRLKAEQKARDVESHRIFYFSLPQGETITARASQQDADSLSEVLPLALQPLRLQALGRLAIRRILSFNIWQKVTVIRLPQVIQEYICFRDICEQPTEHTDRE